MNNNLNMSLTRVQQDELKKIDSTLKKLEQLSEKAGVELDKYLITNDFYYEENKSAADKQSRKRQELFERSGRRQS